MNKKDFLKAVIDHSFEYFSQEIEKPLSFEGFSSYLSRLVFTEQALKNDIYSDNKKFTTDADELGIHLVLLNRYAKTYVKNALDGSKLKTADEFSFLITLFSGNSHTKAELIDKMVLNRTTGIEVLKRLLKKSLIEEYNDPHDKRSKRVSITEEGRNVVVALLPKITQSSQLIAGNLSSDELRVVNQILAKLELYHKENEN